MKNDKRIGFIGGGNMGNALVGGLLHHGHNKENIWVTDPNAQTCQQLKEKWGIHITSNNQDIASLVDILVLAVKPQNMKEVVTQIASHVDSQKVLLVSIAAGITTQQILRWLQQNAALVRVMPNTPALLGKGMAGMYATQAVSALQKKQTETLLQSVGDAVWIENEALMDVVTALSGSGPAYFFYMMECLISGATQLGLPHDIASKLTLNTALGSAFMALEQSDDVAKLREKVTSKGGTTEQGIKVLKDAKLEQILLNVLEAATEQGKRLSEQYD